ncbi:hypothetical protein DFH09DRAFT_934508 [Mycena vulgaris]|nr:hypothetical protein DFH09DRAFT_934508 [Mycena vulgaris]
MIAFLDIILGAKRASKIGILGKVKGWYAVVEAQVRGSLHLHIVIWIEGAPASLNMKERKNSDPEFKQKLAVWYDDLICQSFPKNTVPYIPAEGGPKQLPVLSRPVDPNSEDYAQRRNLCENTGLVHEHNATCFKHIPRRIHSLIDPDNDCRFELPRPLVSETHFDEDGDLVIRCENGNLNGHNPTWTLCLGCNTDLKQTASGPGAMAMVEYMCNYTTKLQVDTSMVFSALCASIKALQDSPPKDIDGAIDKSEMSRLMMVKATNKLVGKRELTGQQTASHLLGRKNRYTSDAYQEYWWSSLLRDIARDVFVEAPSQRGETDLDEEENDASNQLTIPEDEDDPLIVLSPATLDTDPNLETSETGPTEKKYSMLFDNMFYRPPELESMCLWDLSGTT